MLVAQFTHQGRSMFHVHGTDEVHTVYLDMPDMCDTGTPEQTPHAGTDELNWDVPSAWCSCAPFAATVLISTDQLMVCLNTFSIIKERVNWLIWRVV